MINWQLFRPYNVLVIIAVVLMTNFLFAAAKNRIDAAMAAGG
jgi:hypothetical protein